MTDVVVRESTCHGFCLQKHMIQMRGSGRKYRSSVENLYHDAQYNTLSSWIRSALLKPLHDLLNVVSLQCVVDDFHQQLTIEIVFID